MGSDIFKRPTPFAKYEKAKEKVAVGDMPEEQLRTLEMQMFKPDAIPPYTGEEPEYVSDLQSLMALIVFKSKAQRDKIGSVLSVRKSYNGDVYITNIDVLESLATLVEEGKLEIHKEKITIPSQEAPQKEEKIVPSNEPAPKRSSIFQRRSRT